MATVGALHTLVRQGRGTPGPDPEPVPPLDLGPEIEPLTSEFLVDLFRIRRSPEEQESRLTDALRRALNKG